MTIQQRNKQEATNRSLKNLALIVVLSQMVGSKKFSQACDEAARLVFTNPEYKELSQNYGD